MINTRIFIRAEINGEWQSIDIGDPRLSAEQFLRWLVTLKPEGQVVVIQRVQDIIDQEENATRTNF